MCLSWSSAAIFALAQFRDFGAHVAELLGDLAASILIDLNDLQLDLGDFAAVEAFEATSCPRSPSRRAAIALARKSLG